MRRSALRAALCLVPLLGLTVSARPGATEGVDRFAWPLTGSQATGAGFDHDRDECPEGSTSCDTYIQDKECGSDGAYDQHTGTDAYAPAGDQNIYAAAAGYVVSSIDEYGTGKLGSTDAWGFGNNVVIYHGDGLASLYGHMKQDSGLPALGQWVECGEAIGEQGSSGNSSAPHLHFDVRTGVTVSSGDLGGYFTGARVDPFLSEQDDDDAYCGASESMWVEHTGDLPSRTCDDDDYVSDGCHSMSLGIDVDDGTCVQVDSCAWWACLGGAWIALPEEDGVSVCEATNYTNDSCDPVDCSGFGDEDTCAAWAGSCAWSCEEEACLSADDVDEGDCMSMPATCDDEEQNGDETGVDCGGPDCAGCDGDPCRDDDDCVGGSCSGGLCQDPPAACDDGVQNGSETGIDCGGDCLACDGEPCRDDRDCITGQCGGDMLCETPFDCHTYDGDAESCGFATGCVYHECADSCSPNTETACAAGCLDQCGTQGCVRGSLTYFNWNDCITGTASGIAELYREQPGGGYVLDGMVGINGDGSFCADLDVGVSYYLSQSDMYSETCGYYTTCTHFMEVGATGIDGVCADASTCEDLGDIDFDCGS
ncbi:MAG: M23 family metallopeptidase [Myxococcota bacterium]